MRALIEKKIVARVRVNVLAEGHGKNNSVHVVDLVRIAEAQMVRVGRAPSGGVQFGYCVVLDVAVKAQIVRVGITVHWLV